MLWKKKEGKIKATFWVTENHKIRRSHRVGSSFVDVYIILSQKVWGFKIKPFREGGGEEYLPSWRRGVCWQSTAACFPGSPLQQKQQTTVTQRGRCGSTLKTNTKLPAKSPIMIHLDISERVLAGVVGEVGIPSVRKDFSRSPLTSLRMLSCMS